MGKAQCKYLLKIILNVVVANSRQSLLKVRIVRISCGRFLTPIVDIIGKTMIKINIGKNFKKGYLDLMDIYSIVRLLALSLRVLMILCLVPDKKVVALPVAIQILQMSWRI